MRIHKIAFLVVATNACWVASLVLPSVAPTPRGSTPPACRKRPGNCVRTLLSASSKDLPEILPPKDESFAPLATLRELLAAPGSPVGSRSYDGIGSRTGGIWRTKVIGIIASTVVAAPISTKWITKQEAIGNVTNDVPASTAQLIGPNGVGLLARQAEAHSSVRRVFNEVLSPKAVAKLQPAVEAALAKRVARWEQCAASGQEVLMLDDISSHTLEVIARCLLGDYATDGVLDSISRLFPILCSGIMSIPLRFPWPLNKIPTFGFGRSMKSREEFKDLFLGLIRERRADMANARRISGGMLDGLLDMQARQISNGGPKEGGIVFDDDFIVDNVIFVLFAGYDTTATTLARILQLLASTDGQGTVDKLVHELDRTVSTDDEHLDEYTAKRVGQPAPGIFKYFPLLDAVVLETSRHYPVLGGVFRRATQDINFNGYHIPAGTKVLWSVLSGFRAESLYPEPETFCPFRFFHTNESKDDGATTISSTGDVKVADREQPRPEIFGFGKHMCPGRELGKLEILLFLREFLSKFDYEVVEGQSFKGTLPMNAPRDKLRVVLKLKDGT